MTNPWKVLGQKEVYNNNWINVTEYDVLNPAGGKGIYGKVHFHNLAVGVVVLDNELNTYLVGQYRFTLNAYSWEIPEGGGDPAVTPRESAERELLEETGLVAKRWTDLGRYHLSNSVTDEEGFLFLAQDLEQHEAMPEDTEDLKVMKLPLAEAWKMIERGEITDTLSVIALQELRIRQLEGRLTS